jgi:hypothetical protein
VYFGAIFVSQQVLRDSGTIELRDEAALLVLCDVIGPGTLSAKTLLRSNAVQKEPASFPYLLDQSH